LRKGREDDVTGRSPTERGEDSQTENAVRSLKSGRRSKKMSFKPQSCGEVKSKKKKSKDLTWKRERKKEVEREMGTIGGCVEIVGGRDLGSMCGASTHFPSMGKKTGTWQGGQ